MARAVIDASVAVKWFLDEPDTEAALRLQSDFFEGLLSVRVPSVFPYEVMHALHSSRRFSRRELLESARDVDRSGFQTVPLFGDYLERTVDLAAASAITVYEASYLALAASEQCPLYTADEALLSFDGSRTAVRHIRGYPSRD